MNKTETTNDAEELATQIVQKWWDKWPGSHLPMYQYHTKPLIELIQAALTAAYERGFERGKTVSAEETWETTLHDQLCLVLPLAKKYANGCRTITEANLCDEADDMMKAYEVHIASMPDAQDQRGKADVVPAPTIVDWHFLKEAVDFAEDENDFGKEPKYLAAWERLYKQACDNANVVPSGDTKELAERTFYEVKACIELDQAKGFDYDNAISQILRALSITADAARAEGERIGFERAQTKTATCSI